MHFLHCRLILSYYDWIDGRGLCTVSWQTWLRRLERKNYWLAFYIFVYFFVFCINIIYYCYYVIKMSLSCFKCPICGSQKFQLQKYLTHVEFAHQHIASFSVMLCRWGHWWTDTVESNRRPNIETMLWQDKERSAINKSY